MNTTAHLVSRFCLLLAGTISSVAPTTAQETDHSIPGIRPDRLLLTWEGNPSTSVSMTWRTSQEITSGLVEFAKATDGPLFVKDQRRVNGTTSAHQSDLNTAHYHSVHLENLEPDTLYVYRAGDGTNWTEWTHFRTASASASPFTFIYFGDAQNDVRSHWSRVFREAFSDAPRAAFMLHAGDLINRGNRDAEWADWCSAGGWVNAMLPTVAVPGNHEYDITRTVPLPPTRAEQKKLPRSLASRWQQRFAFPDNGPEEFRESLGETAYWFDYQDVRFVALNSMEDFDIQARWLDEVLKDNPCRWTIVTHHHPVYSVSERRKNPELMAAWQPLYDKYNVDLVLQGHDHSYGRTGFRRYAPNKPEGGTWVDSESGTVYVVSVSGPKMYAGGTDPFIRRAEDTQLYQIITVDGDELIYRARTATGKPYDGFRLVKQDGRANQLHNEIPDTPENRRER